MSTVAYSFFRKRAFSVALTGETSVTSVAQTRRHRIHQGILVRAASTWDCVGSIPDSWVRWVFLCTRVSILIVAPEVAAISIVPLACILTMGQAAIDYAILIDKGLRLLVPIIQVDRIPPDVFDFIARNRALRELVRTYPPTDHVRDLVVLDYVARVSIML
jgi:hypothetical protein